MSRSRDSTVLNRKRRKQDMFQEQPNSQEGFAGGDEIPAAGPIEQLEQDYLIKHWFNPGQVGFLIAPPAQGKTAIVAALCAHLALGHEFAGLKVRRSYVYYLAPEDPNGVQKRAYPYLKDYNATSVPFDIVKRVPDMGNADHIDGIIQDIKARKVKAQTERSIVIVDTTNLAIGEADENSSNQMGKIISNAHRIAELSESYVLFLHHTPLGDQSRGRGSGAIKGNTDDEFLLKKAKGDAAQKIVQLTPTKQKNNELQAPITFEIESFQIGFDSEEDKVTVPKAVPFKKQQTTVSQVANSNRRPQPVQSVADLRKDDILRVLSQHDKHEAGSWLDPKSVQALTGDAFNAVRENSESMRKQTKKALDSMVKSGEVETRNKMYRLSKTAATDTQKTE
ncbi:AAA family ATPase [Celeribacter sp. HF31]|uniref:AAA family ATPase n=1 Tax=Celeribacter sp. HF31 TaxID=2721558 RepID=UPI0014315655|nr:AAA family ATPase [Celeribacter sp. HF31]